MYGYYRCPKNIYVLCNGYTFSKDGERLFYTAILQFLSNKYKNVFPVNVWGNGDIQFFISEDNIKTYNMSEFYYDDINGIIYKLDNENERIILERKNKIDKICKKNIIIEEKRSFLSKIFNFNKKN